MLKAFLAGATVLAGLGLSAGAASALPGRGDLGATAAPGVVEAQWGGRYYDDDWRPRRGWREREVIVRRGPPPWAPAWGRRYRERVVIERPRYRERYGYRQRFYEDRGPGFSFRF
jgi:hypothetical protein